MVTGWKRDKRKQCLWYKTKMLQNAFSLLGMLTMEQPCKLSSLMNQQATLTQQCCVISIYTSFKHLLRPSTAYNHPLTKKSATSKNNLGLGLYLKTSLQTKKIKISIDKGHLYLILDKLWDIFLEYFWSYLKVQLHLIAPYITQQPRVVECGDGQNRKDDRH